MPHKKKITHKKSRMVMKPKRHRIIPQKPKDFQEFEYPVLEAYKDENGYYHNENAPAIVTEQTSYFIDHGTDWDIEKYEIFIRKTAQKLFPNENTKDHPFTQIESIVLTTKGWGRREKLYTSPPFLHSPHTLITGKPGMGKTVSIIHQIQPAKDIKRIYLNPKNGWKK